jgi:hypothetical protein
MCKVVISGGEDALRFLQPGNSVLVYLGWAGLLDDFLAPTGNAFLWFTAAFACLDIAKRWRDQNSTLNILLIFFRVIRLLLVWCGKLSLCMVLQNRKTGIIQSRRTNSNPFRRCRYFENDKQYHSWCWNDIRCALRQRIVPMKPVSAGENNWATGLVVLRLFACRLVIVCGGMDRWQCTTAR